MARRRRTSTAEDLIDAVALLPWWGGVALAIVIYLGLHSVAEQPAPAASALGQLAPALTQIVIRTLAMYGQYVAPALCLLGASVSAWRRRERARLIVDVTNNAAAGALQGMSWQDFEKLVGEHYRSQGYRVSETGGAAPDGGVDLVLSKDGEKILVQCKQWRAFKVGVSVVRELYGVMAAQGASGGIVVTSGRFTDEAVAFADGRNVRLVDGPKLRSLLEEARGTRPSRFAPTSQWAETTSPKPDRTLVPTCPLCAKPMTRRVARKGDNAGSSFWGCTGFPACRATKPV
jgi:restriction system protein